MNALKYKKLKAQGKVTLKKTPEGFIEEWNETLVTGGEDGLPEDWPEQVRALIAHHEEREQYHKDMAKAIDDYAKDLEKLRP